LGKREREQATRVGQILHSDLIGPITPASFHTRNKHILIVVDGYSRYAQTFAMETKDETPKMLDAAFRVIQAHFPGVGQFDRLRCDQGGEFESNEVSEILNKYQAVLDHAEADLHEHNGTAERFNKTRLRALIFESGFPANMWGQLLDTATWLYNRTVHLGIGNVTPYEKYTSRPPKLNDVRIVGFRCYVYKTKTPRG
jgi:transposase InsO family protein